MSRRLERAAQKLAVKYSSNLDLVIELLDLLGKDETSEILQMSPKDLRPTARVNTLLVTRSEAINLLKRENIVAQPISEINEGIEILRGYKKLGSSLTYLKGLVMPQGLGSMLTVEALDPQEDEIILDMAAAPGGKSIFIAERMKNTGLLIANDISTARLRSLLFNLSRHKIQNTIVMNQDAKKITRSGFDRILLDAPCTGGGLLVSQPFRRTSKSITDSIQLQRVQIQLLSHALSLLKPGGVCVYSTCAISPVENEMVIENFTNQVSFEIPNISGKNAEIDEKIIGKRLFPHQHKCDGFFIVKMVKE